MNISEKVAYLKGLAEGVEAASDAKEGKILKNILDILEDIAGSLSDLQEKQENLFIYSEELDKDLGTLEKAFIRNYTGYTDNTDNIFDSDGFHDDDEYFGDLEDSAKIDCPKCGELILFDLDDIEEGGRIDCPECGAEISVVGEFSSERRGCGGCGGKFRINENDNDEPLEF